MKIYRVFESESGDVEEHTVGYFDSYDKALECVLNNFKGYDEDHDEYFKQWKKEPKPNSPAYYPTYYVTIEEIEVK